MDKIKLFNSDDEEENESVAELKVNEGYKKSYDNWRKAEEFQRLKNKYGDQVSESSEFSDDSEDDDGEESESEKVNLDEVFDEKFLKVYSALKRNDPKIYDEKFVYGQDKSKDDDEEDDDDDDKQGDKIKEVKEKKMNLIDYHKKLWKEKKGATEEDEGPKERPTKDASYYEQLAEIKNQIKTIVNDDDEDEDGDDLIKVVPKPDEEKDDEESDPLAKDDEDIQYLNKYWKKDESKLDEGEKFLRDYILKKRFIDEELKLRRQFVDDMKEKKKVREEKDGGEENGIQIDEDEEEEDEDKVKSLLSTAPKFHFQEEDGGEIKRFPRVVDSARDLVKDGRSRKRAEAKERKKKEKEEELKRFSELKKEELQKKIEKFAKTSGNEALLSKSDPLLEMLIDDDKDFNPETYDQKMAEFFGDKYYHDDGHEKEDDEPPKFDFVAGIDDEIEQEIENVTSKVFIEEDEESGDEDDGDKQGQSSSKKRRTKNKKRRRKVKAVDIDKLPLFEDIIGGDLPTRFKYRSVTGNSFGLTDEELVLAEDRELNQWASLKKAVGYIPDDEETKLTKLYKSRQNDVGYKKKILKSIFEPPKNPEPENCEDEEKDGNLTSETKSGKKKKRRPKKKNSVQEVTSTKEVEKDKEEEEDGEKEEVGEKVQESSTGKVTSKFKRKRRKTNGVKPLIDVSRLEAYGMTKTQGKKRRLI